MADILLESRASVFGPRDNMLQATSARLRVHRPTAVILRPDRGAGTLTEAPPGFQILNLLF